MARHPPVQTRNTPIPYRGNYVVTLTVTDNLGVSTTNTVSLAVTAPNILPVAKFIVTPPTGPAPLDVVLTSDGSYDPDGAIGNRQWNFSDGGDYFGNTAYHTFSRAWHLYSEANCLRRPRRTGHNHADGCGVLAAIERDMKGIDGLILETNCVTTSPGLRSTGFAP